MTIYDIQNIQHCTVTPVGSIAFRVKAHDGWYIHKATDMPGGKEEEPTVIYRTCVIIALSEDMSGIEIVTADNLPDNAEIC